MGPPSPSRAPPLPTHPRRLLARAAILAARSALHTHAGSKGGGPARAAPLLHPHPLAACTACLRRHRPRIGSGERGPAPHRRSSSGRCPFAPPACATVVLALDPWEEGPHRASAAGGEGPPREERLAAAGGEGEKNKER